MLPQNCPVEGCTSEKIWDSATGLGHHLAKTHLLKGNQYSDLMAAAKSVKRFVD